MRSVWLECVRDLATGKNGLIVEGMCLDEDTPMVAITGTNIAHDLLEHQNGVGAIGGIIDELQALGALYFVRGWTGSLMRSDAGRRYYTVEQAIATDVTRMFRDFYHGVEIDTAIPVTRPCLVDNVFETVLADCHWAEELGEDFEAYPGDHEKYNRALAKYEPLVMPHLRIGWRKAQRRYRGNANQAYEQFWAIADAINPHCREPEPGARFLLRYGRCEATCEQRY